MWNVPVLRPSRPPSPHIEMRWSGRVTVALPDVFTGAFTVRRKNGTAGRRDRRPGPRTRRSRPLALANRSRAPPSHHFSRASRAGMRSPVRHTSLTRWLCIATDEYVSYFASFVHAGLIQRHFWYASTGRSPTGKWQTVALAQLLANSCSFTMPIWLDKVLFAEPFAASSSPS